MLENYEAEVNLVCDSVEPKTHASFDSMARRERNRLPFETCRSDAGTTWLRHNSR